MEHLQHGMKRKWERHFRETNTNISVLLMVAGMGFLVSLMYVYPQVFNKIIFDSRLAFNLLVDVEDYWTCTQQYGELPVYMILLFVVLMLGFELNDTCELYLSYTSVCACMLLGEVNETNDTCHSARCI